ncbi:MAG: SDR family NAD(P)-dependent oxidoreductase [Bacteroidetes bacterium]|nr:SDR family NAD(P)-dependent oxidoreductase [Bacteroidota bacterium]
MDKKLITIVGMGPGVSNSVAKRFAKENFRLALIARNEERLNEYKKYFESLGTEAEVFKADAGSEESLVSAFEKIKAVMGNTDVLHYNVFSMRQATPLTLKYDDCIYDFSVNVAGALLASQLVIPAMTEKKEGCIFFTGGIFAMEPMPVYSTLGIGKAAQRNLCFSMFKELRPKGIHAASVIITGFVKPGTKWDPDAIAEEFWKLYLQKPGEFEREIIF